MLSVSFKFDHELPKHIDARVRSIYEEMASKLRNALDVYLKEEEEKFKGM